MYFDPEHAVLNFVFSILTVFYSHQMKQKQNSQNCTLGLISTGRVSLIAGSYFLIL